MKKLILPCILAFSLLASAQYTNKKTIKFPKEIVAQVNLDLIIDNLPESYAGDEEEITLDFDVEAYLPADFDPYKNMIIDESYLLIEEEIPFDFDIKEYLPKNFDPYKGMIIEEELVKEEIPFDFDINEYLPKGFDPHKKVDQSNL